MGIRTRIEDAPIPILQSSPTYNTIDLRKQSNQLILTDDQHRQTKITMKLSPFCAIAAFLIPAATAAPYIDPIVVGLWYEKPTSGPDNRFLEGAGNMKNPRGPANVVGVFEFDLNGNKDLGVAAKKDFRWSSDKSQNQIQDVSRFSLIQCVCADLVVRCLVV